METQRKTEPLLHMNGQRMKNSVNGVHRIEKVDWVQIALGHKFILGWEFSESFKNKSCNSFLERGCCIAQWAEQTLLPDRLEFNFVSNK